MNETPSYSKYPEALSRQFGEGGYTLLHRVFRQNIDTGKPVIINTGNVYFEYNFEPGHTSFAQGIKKIDGDNSTVEELFGGVINNFDLNIAIREGGYTRSESGEIQKAPPVTLFRRIKNLLSKK